MVNILTFKRIVQVNVPSPLQNPSTVRIRSGCHIQKIMIFMNIMLYSKQMYLNRVRVRVKYHVVYVIVRTCLRGIYQKYTKRYSMNPEEQVWSN